MLRLTKHSRIGIATKVTVRDRRGSKSSWQAGEQSNYARAKVVESARAVCAVIVNTPTRLRPNDIITSLYDSR